MNRLRRIIGIQNGTSINRWIRVLCSSKIFPTLPSPVLLLTSPSVLPQSARVLAARATDPALVHEARAIPLLAAWGRGCAPDGSMAEPEVEEEMVPKP